MDKAAGACNAVEHEGRERREGNRNRTEQCKCSVGVGIGKLLPAKLLTIECRDGICPERQFYSFQGFYKKN